ncbi:PREDICTED: uncharacterized protein LOC109593387 [Amphimedon queenslandica]|uniref:Death domain-containing protein n=1 Tax=Amphimedon queenslandica TaxID=400682 RepID=A0A1X7SFM1_AMPQE|nr:PREDICTED: uncharacterized protein LOC109593387 [Amphimedon queenslandica]|eukprot:XP_019864045.1 PREDICTED: uncharacterized protein LOC109593387 [Amphimedon queenslandica]
MSASLVPTDLVSGPSPETTTDSQNQLQITDLAEVLQLLRRHGYSGVSYHTLSLYLGLFPNTIRVIEADHRGDTERCLSECFTKWLGKADDVQKKGGPTIYSLVSALRRIGGENGVADGIDMEKHPACKILACHSAQQSVIAAALPQLVIVLYLTKLIKEMILPTNVQGENLLIQIKEAVCNDYQKLEAFAVILCKVKATIEIGNSLLKEYSEVFCSDDLVVMNDDNGLKIYLPQSMTAQFTTMRLKFGQTFLKVEKCIKEKSPAHKDIKNILSYYSEDLESQIAHCEST